MKFFEKTLRKSDTRELPLVPLKDLVVFPHMVIPFFAGRKGSILAIEEAMSKDRKVFLSCQKNSDENSDETDIYQTGTVAHILQMMKLPDGTIRVLVEGQERAELREFTSKEPPFRATITSIRENEKIDSEISSLMRTVQTSFQRYRKINKKIPPEIVSSIERAEKPGKLIDLICANLPFNVEKKIALLAGENTLKRLEELAVNIEAEIEMQEIKNKINGRVRKRMEKHQREYYLNEQMKEINRELGKDKDDSTGVKEIEERLKEKELPETVFAKTEKEMKRLAKLQPISPEAGILRTYLEWIADLPWAEKHTAMPEIEEAGKILDEDHYDMDKPKERILDYIAVSRLKEKQKGPILCFVGPPGTGKTSLGRSLARCLGRDFIRISLGGVRDEAEIRGHRKTYVGALPGKIIQSMKKAGSINPVFLLDEVDKISSDYRGDPASALLEVLDPEQNFAFTDHYLEVPYDLSNVIFITTANTLHNIPHPLRDRMEVIEIPGYTEFEKLKIAEGFLIPKQLSENGLDWAQIDFTKESIKEIIQKYTMESGVRNLEREIGAVVRKIARKAVAEGHLPPKKEAAEEVLKNETLESGEKAPAEAAEQTDAPSQPAAEAPPTQEPVPEAFTVTVTPKDVRSFLGKTKYEKDLLYRESRPGLAYGLAWTELGGTLLPVEAVVFDGRGDLILTGHLGDVMKESARTAFSFIKSHAPKFRLPGDFYKGKDIHIHVPEGAIPKDGPSAGVTLTAAILSALSGFPVSEALAMTGEITLTGRILPVGGIKEKVLAAHRHKMKKVLLPLENKKDRDELPKEVLSSIQFIYLDSILEALTELFSRDLFEVRAF